MKPVRLLKKVAAATAAGLLAFGVIAGTASAASADDYVTAGGNAGELSRVDPGNAGELSSLGGNAGELSRVITVSNAGELS